MLRPILRYGASILHQHAAAVADPLTGELRQLVDDMIETMHAAPGVGIAAPQVGVSQRLCAIDLSAGKIASDLIVLINPEFLQRDGMQLEEEGCLSLPGFHATVARAARVTVRGLDRDGRVRTIDASGALARALQHEIDHLDGILFVDRLRAVQRWLMLRRIRTLRHSGQW
jgi:peptide deformylase